MAQRCRRGFTLIELLVVIAIIGILAAMVFPVFARARESARKAVCLSNVKNIGLAIQMYLADNNDTLPPAENRQEVTDYFHASPQGGSRCLTRGWETRANPYLRWPVVLDEYIKNRDVWMCPSAKATQGATFIVPGPDWLGYLRAQEGQWGGWGFGPCMLDWPPGWGGSITDSCLQGRLAGAADQFAAERGASEDVQKVFKQGILTNSDPDAYNGVMGGTLGLKLAAVNDPVKFAICADGGVMFTATTAPNLAYPDICCAACSALIAPAVGWPWLDKTCGILDAECGACAELHADKYWMGDEKAMTAATRHLGGSNIGFLDGHAGWMPARRILSAYKEGDLEGLYEYCPAGRYDYYVANCGDPTGINFLW